jgi:hypothetical protein
MPDTCTHDYRDQQRGLDAKLNSPLQPAEKLFLLTSPFIEPSPPRGRGLSYKRTPPVLLRGRDSMYELQAHGELALGCRQDSRFADLLGHYRQSGIEP